MKVEVKKEFVPIVITLEAERDLEGIKIALQNSIRYSGAKGSTGSIDFNVASALLAELAKI